MPISERRKKWLKERSKPVSLRGYAFLYPTTTQRKLLKSVTEILDGMLFKTRESIIDKFKILGENEKATALGLEINRLRDQYKPSFDSVAELATRGLSQDSEMSFAKALSKIQGGGNISTGLLTGRYRDVFQANAKENVGLFKTIASVHFDRVETAVMDSITTGNGLQDLVPFFESHNPGIKNYAKHRALDQTRKAFTSMNLARMKDAGIDKFEWQHSHGSADPRKLHQELDGKVFDIDNPPYIGDMYGERIHGFPGQLPNCRCTMKPVFEFKES